MQKEKLTQFPITIGHRCIYQNS